MSFQHKGKTFEVWSVDTNVLSQMLKAPTDEMRKVLLLSLGDYAILGFSMWVFLELRRRQDLYKRFISLFGSLPMAILKSPMHLLDDEIQAYPNPSKIQPALFGFNPFGDAPQNNLYQVMKTFFEDNPRYRAAEQQWNTTWQEDALEAILSHRKNFQPKGLKYSPEEIDDFVYFNVIQQVAFRNRSWVQKLVDAGDVLDTMAFPSVRMSAYTVFYRFYDGQRKPQVQDVMDILISGVTPYVECVLTERHHADTINKVKKRDSMLKDLRVETLRSIRARTGEAAKRGAD